VVVVVVVVVEDLVPRTEVKRDVEFKRRISPERRGHGLGRLILKPRSKSLASPPHSQSI
jgi:hypothetical protein